MLLLNSGVSLSSWKYFSVRDLLELCLLKFALAPTPVLLFGVEGPPELLGDSGGGADAAICLACSSLLFRSSIFLAPFSISEFFASSYLPNLWIY